MRSVFTGSAIDRGERQDDVEYVVIGTELPPQCDFTKDNDDQDVFTTRQGDLIEMLAERDYALVCGQQPLIVVVVVESIATQIADVKCPASLRFGDGGLQYVLESRVLYHPDQTSKPGTKGHYVVDVVRDGVPTRYCMILYGQLGGRDHVFNPSSIHFYFNTTVCTTQHQVWRVNSPDRIPTLRSVHPSGWE